MSATPAQIERLLEVNIAAALAEAATGLETSLFWSPAPEGETKALPRSVLQIRVSPRECEGFESDILTLHASIVLLVAAELDARGALLPAAYEAVMGILDSWDADSDAAAAALNIDSAFRCDAVMFSAGGDCGYDENEQIWYASIMLDIKGCALRA